MIETRTFPTIKAPISLLGMGCMRFPTTSADDKDIDEVQTQQMIDFAMQSGVNYYDTAYIYHSGMSEGYMGKALSKYPRNSYYLATKMPIWALETEEDMARIFAEQLERCRTDYFDFYLCHSLGAQSFEKVKSLHVLPFLEKQKEKGHIRHIGFSFHDTPDVLEQICSYYPWEFAQIQLNALDWDIYQSKAQYEILKAHNLPCIIMEPVRGGRLADLGSEANTLLKAKRPEDSIASWSVRFAASLPNVMTVLSGMSNMEQLEENIETLSPLKPLSDDETTLLYEAMDIFHKSATIGCTNCRYCMPCPVNVNIPGVFALYNKAALSGGMKQFEKEYTEFPEDECGKHCVQCGQCESVCPQHLAIPDLLAKLEAKEMPV